MVHVHTADIFHTAGHPSQVMVQIASILTDYLDIDPMQDPSSCMGDFDVQPKTSSQKEPKGQFMTLQMKTVFHENDRTPVLGVQEPPQKQDTSSSCSDTDKCLCIEEERYDSWNSSDERKHRRTQSRRTVLLVLHTLSTLVHWRHNRLVIASRLGSSFAEELVGILHYFSCKIEDITESWSGARNMALHLGHWATDDLLEDTSFVVSALLAMVKVMACSCQTTQKVSECTSSGFLPPQPWKESALEWLGFDMLHFSLGSKGEENLENDMDGTNWCPESTFIRENKKCYSKTSPSWDPSINSTSSSFSSAMLPLDIALEFDSWSAMLVMAGADSVLMNLLRRVSMFGKVLTASPLRSPTNPTADEDKEAPQSNPWEELVSGPWRAAAILQCEILFALLALSTAHSTEFANRFMICDGPQILNMMMLESSCSQAAWSSVGKDLVFQRGILCLRLNEVLNQYYSVHLDSPHVSHVSGESENFTVLITESMGWFLSWMRASYNYEEEHLQEMELHDTANAASDDNPPHTSGPCDDVIVACVQTPCLHAPSITESDLWPWNMQSGETTRANKATEETRVLEITDRATCSNYRMCHPCSEAVSYVQSTKSTDKEYPNVLVLWAKYVETCIRDFPTREEVPLPAALPWFLRGKAARAWQVVFSIMLNTCLGKSTIIFEYEKQTFDTKRRHVMTNFMNVWGASLSTLSESIFDIMNRFTRGSFSSTHKDQEICPLFEMHFLLFIARCMTCAPVSTIEACGEEPEIWAGLFSTKFFLGGRHAVEALLQRNMNRSEELRAKDTPIEGYVSAAGASLLLPVMRCSRLSMPVDVKEDLRVGMVAYCWVYVHDCVLDLTSLITSEANRPPASRIANLKRSFDVKPVIHALQISSERGCDDVTFQLLRWMKWYLGLLSTKALSIRNAMSSQFFRASLAVCGYHLGDVKASAILQKDYADDPVLAAQRSRPFMWSARRAAFEVVIYVLNMADCDRWLKLFASVSSEQHEAPVARKGSSSKELNLSKPGKSPAHVTLMLLFVDVRLRRALCYIIVRVLMRIMSDIQLEEDEDALTSKEESNKWSIRRGDGGWTDGHQATMLKKGLDRIVSPSKFQRQRSDSKEIGTRNYESCVRDIYLDLFELVKWSSRQPAWYDGSNAAISILQSLTEYIRSYRSNPGRMKMTQKWFRMGPIITELISSLSVCINCVPSGSWDDTVKSNVVRHGLSCLTAIMSGDSKNKEEFKATMMSRRSTRSAANSSATGTLSSSGPKSTTKGANTIIIRYDDFNEMILQAAATPDLETILVLMEMLLDEPLGNSRAMLKEFAERPEDICQGFFANQFDRPQIRNLSVIPIIFGIITACSNSTQICILNSFYHLVVGRASLVNISNCSQMNPSLLDMVLDHFPEQENGVQIVAVKLLQTLGRHSISVSQLKRMFQMMRSRGDFRPAHTSLLLRSLQGMIDDDVTPRHSFVFGGVNSGLKIPSIPRWPATSAYTLSMWLRVESPQWNSMLGSDQGSQTSEYRPYVLCLRSANGNGLEVYLKRSHSQRSGKFHLCVTCYSSGGSEVDTLQLPSSRCVVEGRWHYLAISHRSSGFRTSSEVEVMLDDQFVRHKLSYPRFEGIDCPIIGDCAESFRDASLNTTMRGQISAFYLFSDALTEGQLRGIHCLGPSYIYGFEPFNVVHRPIPPVSAERKQAVDPVLSILDGSLSHLIILAYNPAVWKGDLCLDNTPEKNQVKWKPTTLLTGGDTQAVFATTRDSDCDADSIPSQDAVAAFHMAGKMHARSLPGTYRSTTSDVRIALNSLGGIQVLLPLFTQFDQPRVRHELRSAGSAYSVDVLNTFDDMICPALLDLLLTLLVKSSETESFVREYSGIALIGYFLERISPRHWNIQTLEQILRIREKVSWNPAVGDEVFDDILLNFKVWVFTDFEVQFRVLQEVETIIYNMPAKKLREIGAVGRLIDVLYLLYDYEIPNTECIDGDRTRERDRDTSASSTSRHRPTSGSSRSSFVGGDLFTTDRVLGSIYIADRWIHSSSGNIEGVKLAGKKLRFIRSRFLRIIVRIIRIGNGNNIVNPEDISALVRYAVLTTSARSKEEILTILVHFLNGFGGVTEKSVPNVLIGLSISRGLLSLMPLVSHKSAKVRMYTLLLLCMVLRQAAVYPSLPPYTSESKKLTPVSSSEDISSAPEPSFSHNDRSRSPGVGEDSYVTNQHPSAVKSLVEIVSSPLTEDCVTKSDTFSRLGLPTLSLVGVMMWVCDEITTGITSSVSAPFTVDDESPATLEARITAQALQYALMGESCAALGADISSLPDHDEFEGEQDEEATLLDEEDVFYAQGSTFNDVIELNSPVTSRASLEKAKPVAADLSPINNVADKTGRLTESSVCIPMLLPAILGLIRQRQLSIALRLSVMVNIRTFILQHNDNCDRILRIPAWQDYFFHVIVEENAVGAEVEGDASAGDEEARNRYVIKSQALTDTCLRTLCDIQFAAVRIGRPVGPPQVASPIEVSDSSRRRMTVERIYKETRMGSRQLGVSVLRETMSFLRIYHRTGQIDMYPTAFSLLQQTVNALQRESDMLVSQRRPSPSDTDESNMKVYLQKILTLNIWLVGAVVLEFLTFPLARGMAPLLPTSDTDDDTFSRLQASVTSTPERSIRSTSTDFALTPPMNHSPLMTPRSSPARAHSRKSLLKDSFNESGSSLNPYEEAMWNLVISLTQLMGPLGPVEVETYEQYGSISNQVEYLTGKKSAPRIDATVSAIVAKPGECSATINGQSTTSGHTTTKKATPFNQAVGGVYWIMVRVLCSVFTQGSMVADMEDSSNSSKSILALMQLKSLIAFICDQKLEGLGFEINNVIGRLSGVLQSTSLPVTSEWVQGALKVLIDLVSIQRSTLLTLIMAASQPDKTEGNDDEVRPSVFMSALSAMRTTSALSLFSRDDAHTEVAPVTTIDQMHKNLPDYVKLIGHYIDRDAKTYTTADAALEAIRLALAVPEEFDLDWRLWTSVMIPVMAEADAIEADYRRTKLTEMGLHKHSEEVRAQLDQQRLVESKAFHDVANSSSSACVLLRESKIKSLQEQFRSIESGDRRIIAKWNQIVSRLANERGPWGSSTADELEVFWMVDPAETNSRMTPLLRRNEEGTRHQMATFMSRGKKDNVVATESCVISTCSTNEPKEAGGAKPAGSAFISPQGLWRDLMKYQKNASIVDSQAEAAEKLDVEDDDDEAKDSPVDIQKVLFKAPVEIITNATNSAGGSTVGTLEVTKHKITFTRSTEELYSFVNKTANTEFLWACQCFPSTVWNTNEVWNIYGRSYQLRYVAVEVFFTSRRVVFFNLYDHTTQRQFYDVIRRLRPPYLQPHYAYKPSSIMSKAIHIPSGRTMTQAWVHRKISNYEYLMYINTIAGRSFNDMSQYPVFPWVLANYTSSKLNLTEAKNFRDLHWPMGAQQEQQREIFRQKYRDLEECYYAALEERKYITDPQMQSDCLPPFHYGSHYSTMGFVLWYLIRQEPFTSLNIWMQDGRFDKPDRIFDTIELCWRGCTSNQADVKELIPEFFYCPEFLENPNGISLGTTSVQKELGPVGLPPWAKNAHDFIRQHRNALESEYVSAHLHHWIDLVFGYKQRPPHMGGSEAAVEACNVYFHLTYAGAVDLENLRENDVPLYSQMVRQIDNYGQTPTQLFTRPHPRRLPLCDVDIFWPIASVVPGVDTIPRGAALPERPRRVVCFKEHVISASPVVFIAEINTWDKLITVDSSRMVATHFWQIRPPDVVPPFQFKVDVNALRFSLGSASGGFNISSRLTGYNTSVRDRRVGVPFAPHRLLRSDYVHDMSSRRIRLPAGNRALFEKEEAARSNWRMRGHSGISTSSSKRSTTTTSDGDESMEQKKEPTGSTGMDTEPIVLRRADEHISTHLFALCPENRLLFSCGHWDYSFKATSIDTGRLLQSVSQHRDVVTCMDLASDFGDTWLVTGSRDCTVIIWEIHRGADKPISQRPLHVLYGHDDAVNCVNVCVEVDVVVSGSDDGTIIVHKLREGIYIRSISVEPTPSGSVPHSPSESSMNVKSTSSWRGRANSHDNLAAADKSRTSLSTESMSKRSPSVTSSPSFPSPREERSVNRSLLITKRRVHNVGVSTAGFIYAYSNDDSALYTFTINGHPQARKITGERLHAFKLSEDNRVLITGGERGLIVMRWVHSLELSNVGSKWDFESVLDGSNAEEFQKPFNSPIRSIYLTQQERHMIVGLESGEMRILAQVSAMYVFVLYGRTGFVTPTLCHRTQTICEKDCILSLWKLVFLKKSMWECELSSILY